MKALTGIKKDRLKRLKGNRKHTFELVTTDNTGVATEVKENEDIFITSEGKKDLSTNTEGMIGEVKLIKTFHQKINTLFDEKEAFAVRLQVDYIGEGKVTDIMLKDRGVEVDIEKNVWMG